MIDYNDTLHRYSYQGVRYISVTQLIEKYKNPFDIMRISQEVTERRGGDAQLWRDIWKQENKKSLVRGSTTHDGREMILVNQQQGVYNGKVYPVPNPDMFPDRYNHDYMLWPDGIYTELILWSHHWQVAGRADMVIFVTVNGVRYAYVHDYKTNKQLKTRAFYDAKTGIPEKLLYPLDHIDACNYNEYNLQLSLYANMLEDMGFVVGGLTLEHIPHRRLNAPGTRNPKPVIEHLEYKRNDVLLMLSDYESKGNRGM